MGLRIADVGFEFKGELDDGFEGAFRELFARRYLPDVSEHHGEPDVVIERFKGDNFRVFSAAYDSLGVDVYRIESGVPSAYGHEAPVFFVLQAAARAGAKHGRIFLTDSVAVVAPDGRAILFVGYPHTGKSTVSALALHGGHPVLSTENTVVEVRDGTMQVVGGTDVLVYDPRVEDVYGISVPYDEQTRSGYRIKDLGRDSARRTLLERGVEVGAVVILHAAFNCNGVSFSRVKGRKVKKALWYFSTALMKGLDYYEPLPLHVPMNSEISANLSSFLETASECYGGCMYEAFGDHRQVFETIMRKMERV